MKKVLLVGISIGAVVYCAAVATVWVVIQVVANADEHPERFE